MHDLLKIGQTVYTESSSIPCTVEQFLGGGGQGEVYRANLGGQSVALKWYLPRALRGDPDQRSRLEAAIESGARVRRFDGSWHYVRSVAFLTAVVAAIVPDI